MQLSGNTILITGGATGIGFSLADRFIKKGNTVIICGRREEALAEAKSRIPELHTYVCDVSNEAERVALLFWVTQTFPELNVLINNAGIQRRVNLTEHEPWEKTMQEIEINFAAPVHLCMLFIAHLEKQANPAIINVSSGLAFTPLSSVPIYCATKAAMHSFTLSLRHQLRATPIEVIEVQPPAVNTDLGGPGLHTFGVPVSELTEAVMQGLAEGKQEISHSFSKESSRASRDELDTIFKRMNPQ